jgi:hypothetical protein
MEIQEIDVLIEEDGRVSLTVRGARGQKCLQLTQELEEALGNQILSRQMTLEANLDCNQEVSQEDYLFN